MKSAYHQRRNRRIRELYQTLRGESKMPQMHIYAHIAGIYDISEERVRQIVHGYI